MSYRLRRLRDSDIGEAIDLARAFHAESAYCSMPLAIAKVADLVQRALTDKEMWCTVVIDSENDAVVGYMMAICHEHYFSYTRTCTDLGFYILPRHRTANIARDMLTALEGWAFHVKQVADISLGISAGIANEGIERFYKRCGYTRGYSGMIKTR
jgi:GNAT superfamily N-acetyltransferase